MTALRAKKGPGLLLVVVTLLLSLSSAASSGRLRVRLMQQNDRVISGFMLRDIVDAPLRKRLRSGLTNHIVVDARLLPDGFGQSAVFHVQRSYSIVYDLWEDRFIVKASGGGPKIARRFDSQKSLEAWLSDEHIVVLGQRAGCDSHKSYHVELSVSINPVSQKVLRRSREMISGSGEESASGQSRSLFGSVARIFFNISADHDVRVVNGRSGKLPFNAIPRRR